MSSSAHDRAQILAGAIALGEATDAQRVEYRSHLAGCAECRDELGGEIELQRTAATVALARESELWTPSATGVLDRAIAARRRVSRVGAGLAAACVLACVGLYAAAVGVARVAPRVVGHVPLRVISDAQPPTAHARPLTRPKPAAMPSRRLVVVHNVVQLYRAQVSPGKVALERAPARPAAVPKQIAEVVVHPAKNAAPAARDGALPPAREGSDWTTVARTTTTALTESAPHFEPQNAESIHVAAFSTREAEPVGGETAINPQPAMIAQSEGAEGTAVFEAVIDERGYPVKCTITKSSTYAVLDVAVCKAAMKVRYSPKVVNGRAVPGVYRDAFTFRLSGNPGE